MYVFPEGGGKPEKKDIPESEMGKAQELHNELVEIAAEVDEELMEKFFDEGTLSEDELSDGLTIALSNQDFYPVFISSAINNMGSGRIMGFINDIAPSPADTHSALLANGDELECSVDGDTVLFIFKTMSEPQVGLVSYFKVYSGVLKSGMDLVNLTYVFIFLTFRVYFVSLTSTIIKEKYKKKGYKLFPDNFYLFCEKSTTFTIKINKK